MLLDDGINFFDDCLKERSSIRFRSNGSTPFIASAELDLLLAVLCFEPEVGAVTSFRCQSSRLGSGDEEPLNLIPGSLLPESGAVFERRPLFVVSECGDTRMLLGTAPSLNKYILSLF